MSGTTLFTVVLDQSRLRTESLVMRLRRMATVALAGLLVVVISQSMPVEAGLFVQPTASELSGTSPSGLLWTAVATGTALPVRSSATSAFNGAPGAVVYVNTATGLMQFDPKGLDVSALVITNTTGTVFTISSNTFPAVVGSGGLPPTTPAARLGMTIGAPLGPELATTGGVGSTASTNGWWNLPWAFPAATFSGSTLAISDFATIGQNSSLNANTLGWGIGRGTFQYAVNGVVGSQVGAVIPVTAPEPSAVVLAGVGIVATRVLQLRLRKRAG